MDDGPRTMEDARYRIQDKGCEMSPRPKPSTFNLRTFNPLAEVSASSRQRSNVPMFQPSTLIRGRCVSSPRTFNLPTFQHANAPTYQP